MTRKQALNEIASLYNEDISKCTSIGSEYLLRKQNSKIDTIFHTYNFLIGTLYKNNARLKDVIKIMNKKLRKIINFYGIEKQLKYFQSEVFELNEAIIKKRNKGAIENMITVISNGLSVILNTKTVDPSRENIKEEIADVMVMLKQFQLYYNISTEEIRGVMKNKIARQLERIDKEAKL